MNQAAKSIVEQSIVLLNNSFSADDQTANRLVMDAVGRLEGLLERKDQHLRILVMDFDDVVRKRKMIRRYKPNQISDSVIDKLIYNASKAPSAGHTQVQEFIVVKDLMTRKKLRQASLNQKHVEDAPVLIVVCSNTSRSVGRYGNRGREFYSVLDGAFASMLILLTAANERIGAGFVAAFEDSEVSKILKLPEYVKPIGIIGLGYPDEEPRRLERREKDRLVHYEHWQLHTKIYTNSYHPF